MFKRTFLTLFTAVVIVAGPLTTNILASPTPTPKKNNKEIFMEIASKSPHAFAVLRDYVVLTNKCESFEEVYMYVDIKNTILQENFEQLFFLYMNDKQGYKDKVLALIKEKCGTVNSIVLNKFNTIR